MSWRDRATKVENQSESKTPSKPSWKDRATKVEGPSITSQIMDGVSRGLDYTGGIGRTAAAGLVDPFVKEDIVTNDDVKNALIGKAPDTAEYMERAKVPAGAEVDLNPLMEGKTSVRDIGGFVGDIALDPATYVSMGAVPALKGFARPFSNILEKSGKSIYKSGLKKVDEKLLEKGVKPVSEVLFNEGITGTNNSILKKVKALNADLAPKRAALYDEASKLGAKVDPKIAMQGADSVASKIHQDPGLRNLAEKLSEKSNLYKSEGPVDLAMASNWKTNLYDSLPQDAFNQFGRVKKPAKEFTKAQARGLKDAILEAAESKKQGLGKNIDELNEKWASLLSAEKPLFNEVKKGKTKNFVSSVDGLIGGLSVANPATGLPILALKKAADLSKTTAARTVGGMATNKVGKSGAVDPIIRQAIVESQEDNKSFWDMINKKKP